MSTPEPHRISRRSVLRGAAVAGTGAALSPLLDLSTASAATAGDYTVRFDLDSAKKQTILGLGFEIQSDSIGSGNNGLPATVSGVPYDLTPAERTRFYRQLVKGDRADRGFRYCRLALGLYHRGLDPTGKHIVDRYPGQTELLAQMISQGGMEGVAAEYWSPAPGWKSNNSYISGTIASVQPAFLDQLGDAMVGDLDYLSARGVPISMWGLQNEPDASNTYSTCQYTPEDYLRTFKAVAPKVKARYPHATIHADSRDGWQSRWGAAVAADPAALSYVDAWSFHRIGSSSNEQMTRNYTSGAAGRPVFNNEFEYLDNRTSDDRTINTAQSIMNWMTFQNSPTWFWLHALKPTTNAESPGYSLGFWRPPSDTDFGPGHFPDLPVGHWTWNPQNWNAVAGFVKYLPWNSVRYHVDESAVLGDQRIMAWKTPAGKPVLAVTNRSATQSFTYTVNTLTAAAFQGHRYGPATNNQDIPTLTGPTLTITVPPRSIEFWVRTP